MRSWPAWLAILIGALVFIGGVWMTNTEKNPSYFLNMLLPASILLAVGLHALQQSYDAFCDCASCNDGGCGCCGDGCACGDCPDCKGGAGGHEGHEGHGHDGGHEHAH